jgi:uncharacterized membrane protein
VTHRHKSLRIFQALATISASFIASGSAPAAAFDPVNQAIRLVDLGPGMLPTAINLYGQVAGQGADGIAFLWQDGEFTPLGTLGGAQSYANDLNDAGVVVGWSHDTAGKMKSFRWGAVPGTMENLDATVVFQGVAEAINNRAEIVGWRSNGTSFRSTFWDASVPNGEILFPGSSHKAFGINDFGDVVGVKYLSDLSFDEGYYWDSSSVFGEMTAEIGTDFWGTAGINNNRIAAGQENTGSGYYALGNLDSDRIPVLSLDDTFSIANGLNNNDIIVGESDQKGYFYDLSADFQLPLGADALYNANEFIRFGASFDSIVRLLDINDGNNFVGVALVDGVEHGFVGDFLNIYGDFTGDLAVTAADLANWQAGFGTTGAMRSQGDANYDGRVDGADFLVWQRQLGSNFGPPAQPVPESAAHWLVVLTVLGAACPRPRGHVDAGKCCGAPQRILQGSR